MGKYVPIAELVGKLQNTLCSASVHLQTLCEHEARERAFFEGTRDVSLPHVMLSEA
jgi:hypothetical protein